jgi:LmbE family N-acetylglucosaminyl deacetylase
MFKEAAAKHALLAVFAHPDDESLACGGLLAWCAAVGVRVSLLCVTCGDDGPTHATGPPSGTPPSGSVRDIRGTELRDAAGVLGIKDDAVTILDHADGMLPWIDVGRLEADIQAVIRRTAPDVVITFGEDGLYWHPDHIAVHERTTAAVATLDDDVPALYYVTMPTGAMRAVVDHAAEVTAGRSPEATPPHAILGVADADAFGALAATPTLVVETGRFAAQKLRAISCHRSQFRDCALALVDQDDAPRLIGTEHYRRADAGAQGDTFLERFAAPFRSARTRPTRP